MGIKTDDVKIRDLDGVSILIDGSKSPGAAMVVFDLDGACIAVPAKNTERAIAKAESFVDDIMARRVLAVGKLKEAMAARDRGKLLLAKHLYAEARKLNGGRDLEDL